MEGAENSLVGDVCMSLKWGNASAREVVKPDPTP